VQGSDPRCPLALVDFYTASAKLVISHGDYAALFGITASLLVAAPSSDRLTADTILYTRTLEEQGMLREALICLKLLLWSTMGQRSSMTMDLLLLCLDLQREAGGSLACKEYLAWILTCGKKGNCWGSAKTEMGREELLSYGLSEVEVQGILGAIRHSPCAGHGLADIWPALFYGARLELEEGKKDEYYSICEFIQDRLTDNSKFLTAFINSETKRNAVIGSVCALIERLRRTSRVPTGYGHWAGVLRADNIYAPYPQAAGLGGQALVFVHPAAVYGLPGYGTQFPQQQAPRPGPLPARGHIDAREFVLPCSSVEQAKSIPASLLIAYLDVLLICVPSNTDLLERFVSYATQIISLQPTCKESIWKLNLYSTRIYLANGMFERAWDAVSLAIRNANCNTQWKCYFLAAKMLIENTECRTSSKAVITIEEHLPARVGNTVGSMISGRAARFAEGSQEDRDSKSVARASPYPIAQSLALLIESFSHTSKRFQPTVVCEICKYYEYSGRYQEALDLYVCSVSEFPGEWKLISEAALLARKLDSARAASGQGRFAGLETGQRSYTSRLCEFFLRGENESIGRIWAILVSEEEDICRKAVLLARGLRLAPGCTELWLEALRMFLNPLNSCFSVELARECLAKALYYIPQNGDSYIEWLRISILEYLLTGKDFSADFSSCLDKALSSSPSHGRIWAFLTPAHLKAGYQNYQGPASTEQNVLDLAKHLVAEGIFKYRALYKEAWERELHGRGCEFGETTRPFGRFSSLEELLSLGEVPDGAGRSSAPAKVTRSNVVVGTPSTPVFISKEELRSLAAKYPVLGELWTMSGSEVLELLARHYGKMPNTGERDSEQSKLDLPKHLFATAVPFYDYAFAFVHVRATPTDSASNARGSEAIPPLHLPIARSEGLANGKEKTLDMSFPSSFDHLKSNNVRFVLPDELRKHVIFGPDTSI